MTQQSGQPRLPRGQRGSKASYRSRKVNDTKVAGMDRQSTDALIDEIRRDAIAEAGGPIRNLVGPVRIVTIASLHGHSFPPGEPSTYEDKRVLAPEGSGRISDRNWGVPEEHGTYVEIWGDSDDKPTASSEEWKRLMGRKYRPDETPFSSNEKTRTNPLLRQLIDTVACGTIEEGLELNDQLMTSRDFSWTDIVEATRIGIKRQSFYRGKERV